MNQPTANVAILGSTGSIGRNALEVIAAIDRTIRVVGLSAHRRFDDLVEQARAWKPDWVVATGQSEAADYPWPALGSTRIERGHDRLAELVTANDIDLVIAAIVGSAGLSSTLAALQAGKNVALANKETLVAAGPLVLNAAKASGAKLLPVDSEHCAIFQAIQCGQHSEVSRVILTASGGPFRNHPMEALQYVTVDEALEHPTWDMGPKISIDSATMMNKALEIIEARWLFDLSPEQIEVVIHPQSVVHSMVEFRDGSILAQMSPPDMRLPIQYALTYPHRLAGPSPKMDFSQIHELQFFPPDRDRFPAIDLGLEVARAGGSCGVVVNAANEAAVAAFLAGNLSFLEIVSACRDVMLHHDFDPQPNLQELLRLDRWAREEIHRWISA
jgi:1-deoxy-D-xylulose-5-phosphate reductoisomerase